MKNESDVIEVGKLRVHRYDSKNVVITEQREVHPERRLDGSSEPHWVVTGYYADWPSALEALVSRFEPKVPGRLKTVLADLAQFKRDILAAVVEHSFASTHA